MIMNGHNKPPSQAQKIPHARLEDEMAILDTKLDHWATNNLPLDKYSKLLSNKGLKKREQQQHQQQQHQQQQQIQQQNGSGSFSSSSSTGSTSTMSSSSMGAKNNELLSAIKLTGVKHQTIEAGQDAEQAPHSTTTTTCSYCAISFQTRNELRQHCQTESHQKVIMSDEGMDSMTCKLFSSGFPTVSIPNFNAIILSKLLAEHKKDAFAKLLQDMLVF